MEKSKLNHSDSESEFSRGYDDGKWTWKKVVLGILGGLAIASVFWIAVWTVKESATQAIYKFHN